MNFFEDISSGTPNKWVDAASMSTVNEVLENSLTFVLDQPNIRFLPGNVYTTTHPQYYYDVPTMSTTVPFQINNYIQNDTFNQVSTNDGFYYVMRGDITNACVQIVKYKVFSITPILNVKIPTSFTDTQGSIEIIYVQNDNIYWINTYRSGQNAKIPVMHRSDLNAGTDTVYPLPTNNNQILVTRFFPYLKINPETLAPTHMYTTWNDKLYGLYEINLTNYSMRTLMQNINGSAYPNMWLYKHMILYIYISPGSNDTKRYTLGYYDLTNDNNYTIVSYYNASSQILQRHHCVELPDGLIVPLFIAKTDYTTNKQVVVVLDTRDPTKSISKMIREVTVSTLNISDSFGEYTTNYSGSINTFFIANKDTFLMYYVGDTRTDNGSGKIVEVNGKLYCYLKFAPYPKLLGGHRIIINGVMSVQEDGNWRFTTLIQNADVYPYVSLDASNKSFYYYTTSK